MNFKVFSCPFLVSFQQSHGVQVDREEIAHFGNFLDFPLHLCLRNLAGKIRETDRGQLVFLDKGESKKNIKTKLIPTKA